MYSNLDTGLDVQNIIFLNFVERYQATPSHKLRSIFNHVFVNVSQNNFLCHMRELGFTRLQRFAINTFLVFNRCMKLLYNYRGLLGTVQEIQKMYVKNKGFTTRNITNNN